MGSDLDFSEALCAARRGDAPGFDWLFRRFGRPVLAFLRARGAIDGDELVNDVFLAAFRNLASFDGGESDFASWLFTIARNKAIDRARWRARRHQASNELDDQIVRAAESADGVVADRSSLDDLLARLSGLTADQRDVLILRFVNDLSIEQTAAVLDKTPGAVKQLQLRALEGARRLISEQAVT